MTSVYSSSTGVSLADLRRRAGVLTEVARRHHGTGRVEVFGSVARGEQSETSDVDLLVEFDPGATLLDLAAVEREFAEVLGCAVDVMSLNGKGRAADRARSQAVPLRGFVDALYARLGRLD